MRNRIYKLRVNGGVDGFYLKIYKILII